MRYLHTTLILTLWCPFVRAAEPEVLKHWEFDATRGAAAWGWGGLHDGELVEGGDSLRIRITGVDPFIVSPPMDVPLDGVGVRMRLHADLLAHGRDAALRRSRSTDAAGVRNQ